MVYRFKKKNKMFKEYAIYTLIVVLLVTYGIMLYFTTDIYSTLSKRTKEQYEATRGSNFDIIEVLARDCEECYNPQHFENALTSQGATIKSVKKVYFDSEEGKKIVEKYKISSVPAIIVSGELHRNHTTNLIVNTFGENVSDSMVVTQNMIPYLDIKTGNKVGLVTVTYLTDNSCQTCYNVTDHRQIIERYGVYIKEEVMVDDSSSEGKTLIDKYNISYLPTILLNDQAVYYSSFMEVWPNVGTIESDGTFVFRNTDIMEQLGGYSNTTKVV